MGNIGLGVVVQVSLLLGLHFNHLRHNNCENVHTNTERIKICTKLEKIRQKIEIRKYPIQEVLVGDEAGLSPQGNHASLDTNRLALRSVKVVCAPDLDLLVVNSHSRWRTVSAPGEFLVVDVGIDVHLPGVDLHDARPRFLGGCRELYFTVKPWKQDVMNRTEQISIQKCHLPERSRAGSRMSTLLVAAITWIEDMFTTTKPLKSL